MNCELATQTLIRQHKHVRWKGRLHAALNTAERHALRIAVKKLHYAAELSLAFTHKSVRAATSRHWVRYWMCLAHLTTPLSHSGC
ncbi:MAG: CHAD domain-containing protein [Pseudomonadota bacterium]|nr:CHAD domain-containing protein [Pseudomonadota bacterium]